MCRTTTWAIVFASCTQLARPRLPGWESCSGKWFFYVATSFHWFDLFFFECVKKGTSLKRIAIHIRTDGWQKCFNFHLQNVGKAWAKKRCNAPVNHYHLDSSWMSTELKRRPATMWHFLNTKPQEHFRRVWMKFIPFLLYLFCLRRTCDWNTCLQFHTLRKTL